MALFQVFYGLAGLVAILAIAVIILGGFHAYNVYRRRQLQREQFIANISVRSQTANAPSAPTGIALPNRFEMPATPGTDEAIEYGSHLRNHSNYVDQVNTVSLLQRHRAEFNALRLPPQKWQASRPPEPRRRHRC